MKIKDAEFLAWSVWERKLESIHQRSFYDFWKACVWHQQLIRLMWKNNLVKLQNYVRKIGGSVQDQPVLKWTSFLIIVLKSNDTQFVQREKMCWWKRFLQKVLKKILQKILSFHTHSKVILQRWSCPPIIRSVGPKIDHNNIFFKTWIVFTIKNKNPLSLKAETSGPVIVNR